MDKMSLLFKIGLIALIFTVVSCDNSLKNSTQNELGETIFNLVQDNDVESILKLYPSVEDFEALLKKSTTPEEQKAEAREELNKHVAETETKLKEAMLQIDDFVKENNIVWADCKHLNTDVYNDTRDGLEISDISVNFSYGDKNYVLRVSSIIKSDRGWLLLNLPNVNEKF